MHEEHKKFLERLDQAKDKIMARVEKRLDDNDKMPSDLLMDFSDIVKDMSKAEKNIVKTLCLLSEHKKDAEL